MLIPINITGATQKSRSRPLSAQLTQNLYAEVVDGHATKSSYVLHAFPGMKLFGNAAGVSRGMLPHNGALYRVVGTTLYEVGPSGAHTSLGTIPGAASNTDWSGASRSCRPRYSSSQFCGVNSMPYVTRIFDTVSIPRRSVNAAGHYSI